MKNNIGSCSIIDKTYGILFKYITVPTNVNHIDNIMNSASKCQITLYRFSNYAFQSKGMHSNSIDYSHNYTKLGTLYFLILILLCYLAWILFLFMMYTMVLVSTFDEITNT